MSMSYIYYMRTSLKCPWCRKLKFVEKSHDYKDIISNGQAKKHDSKVLVGVGGKKYYFCKKNVEKQYVIKV